ncbi:methylenetetrahydrofolate reductase [Rhizobium puerariae]|uniref:Methylenetetrahydrofolate reductase n=1 Tax=Rhizobium puerariae TaxID=1585791 RepID=A0ABV6AUJ2_9HYPH
MERYHDEIPADVKSHLQHSILDGYTLELTAKDVSQLDSIASSVPAQTVISVPFLPTEQNADRVEAAKAVRDAGFEPMPHIAARRMGSRGDLEDFLSRWADRADITRLLLLAGDLDPPKGPFVDTATILRSGVLQDYGIKHVAVAGHPEKHPVQSREVISKALLDKRDILENMKLEWSIFTQFAFSAEPVVSWIRQVRSNGIDVPIHIGIPGPASVKTLLRFAAVCGVSASTAVMKKYGLSVTQLLTSATPDRLVDHYANSLVDEALGQVKLHFYPFGGVHRTVDWIRCYQDHCSAPF